MAPIVYRKTAAKLEAEERIFLLGSFVFVVPALAGWAEFAMGTSSYPAVYGISCSILAVVFISLVLRYHRHGSPADNFLRLDTAGLTHGYLGKLHRWTWSELSDFEVRGTDSFWSLTGFHAIPIAKRGENGWARFLRRWAREPVNILNVYDAPLDEIAAAFNEYREQALGGGVST